METQMAPRRGTAGDLWVRSPPAATPQNRRPHGAVDPWIVRASHPLTAPEIPWDP